MIPTSCRSPDDDNFYLDDEERRIGNPWTHAKLITEASISLDLDADTSGLAEDQYYVVDVSTNLPISPNISPVGLHCYTLYPAAAAGRAGILQPSQSCVCWQL